MSDTQPPPRAADMLLPAEAQPLLAALSPHLTQPTYTRLVVLTAAAVVTTGRRTVANLLRTVGDLAPGHPASYRRVLSAAEWSGLALGCALARFLLAHVVPDGPVHLVGDDTVDGHPGPRVYGKGRHRDAVRSSHSFTAWRYGHKWVVLAVLVQFPFAARRWALPVLVDLYRTPEVSRAEWVRHRTPAQLMCRLLRVLLIRFPDRTFVFAGDAGYGTHAVARFCHRHRRRLPFRSDVLARGCQTPGVMADVFNVRGSAGCGRRCPGRTASGWPGTARRTPRKVRGVRRQRWRSARCRPPAHQERDGPVPPPGFSAPAKHTKAMANRDATPSGRN